jgi:glutamine amidotransferase
MSISGAGLSVAGSRGPEIRWRIAYSVAGAHHAKIDIGNKRAPIMARVCVLDYGSGNVRSVFNLFRAVCNDVIVSNLAADMATASHLVLPGVGAFGAAMRRVGDTIPMAALRHAALDNRKPFLGICVGMQVLADRGLEFGDFGGLGWIPGEVGKLKAGRERLPHIGWNDIRIRHSSPLLQGLGDGAHFYFLHSYVFRCADPSYVVATTDYGEEFCSVVQSGNLFGVQFHPEKSQRAGQRVAENFLNL